MRREGNAVAFLAEVLAGYFTQLPFDDAILLAPRRGDGLWQEHDAVGHVVAEDDILGGNLRHIPVLNVIT